LPNQLSFGQTCSHTSSSKKLVECQRTYLIPTGLWKTAILLGFFSPHTLGSASLQHVRCLPVPKQAFHAYPRGNRGEDFRLKISDC
jgi:hypothetical protein